MRKAPTVPTHPSQGVPASPADEIQRETPGVPSHPSQDVPSSQRKKVDQDQVQVLLDLRNLKENTMKPQQG